MKSEIAHETLDKIGTRSPGRIYFEHPFADGSSGLVFLAFGCLILFICAGFGGQDVLMVVVFHHLFFSESSVQCPKTKQAGIGQSWPP